MKLDREIGNREGEANALGNIGNVYWVKGELDKALKHYQQALKIFEEIGAVEGIKSAKYNISKLEKEKP